MSKSTDIQESKGTLTDFLIEAFDGSDDDPVSIEMQVTLGTLRKNRAFFDAYAISRCKRLPKSTSRSSRDNVALAKNSSGKGKHLILKKDVLDAISKNQNTATTIANFLGAESAQVRKSLSRYVKEGLIVRTGHGEYGLK